MRQIPNALSVLRAFLAVPVVLSLRAGRDGAALLLVVVALATDALDGYLARRFQWTSRAGHVLDPVADKVLAAALALSLWAWRDLPGWFLLVVIGRDLLLLLGGAIVTGRTGTVPASTLPGKIAFTALGAVFVVWLLGIRPLFGPALVAGTALLLLSLVLYGTAFFRRSERPRRGGSGKIP